MTTASNRLSCVIAGAGLGGLTAAIALRRAGHQVTVLERADALGTVGAGIQIAPNAARLLGELGVIERMQGSAVMAEAAIRRRWTDGRVLGTVTFGTSLQDRVGALYWCVHRADVHAALIAAATDSDGDGDPVQILLGEAVVGVASTGPGDARLLIADGSEHVADVAIGADGIRSSVRDALWPQAPPATFTGQVTHRHIVPVEALGDDGLLDELIAFPAQNIWLGPGGHAITHPLAGGSGFYLGITIDGSPDDEAFWSAAGDTQQMLERMAGWDPRVLRMIAAASSCTAWGLHDGHELDEWVDGRLALIGDACHAMLPFQSQGLAQAIEDGFVLGGLLDGTDASDVPAALRRYAQLRKPRATRVQAASRENGGVFHLPDGPQQRARDEQLGQGSGDFRSYEWLWKLNADGTAVTSP